MTKHARNTNNVYSIGSPKLFFTQFVFHRLLSKGDSHVHVLIRVATSISSYVFTIVAPSKWNYYSGSKLSILYLFFLTNTNVLFSTQYDQNCLKKIPNKIYAIYLDAEK